MGYFILDNKASSDFGVHVSGHNSWATASREVETANIPGRNGALISYVGAWKNVTVTYPAWVSRDFEKRFDVFAEWWNAHTDDYYMLTDPYHPEHYRLARPVSPLNPKVGALNRSGSFDLQFSCKPQKFLRDGLYPKRLQSGQSLVLKNPTGYVANPIIIAKIEGMSANELDITDGGGNSIAYMEFGYEGGGYDFDGKDVVYDAETHEATVAFPFETISANSSITETLGTGYTEVCIPTGELVFFQSYAGDFEIYPRWYTI